MRSRAVAIRAQIQPPSVYRLRGLGDDQTGIINTDNPWEFLKSVFSIPTRTDLVNQCIQDQITASVGKMSKDDAERMCGIVSRVYLTTQTPSWLDILRSPAYGPFAPTTSDKGGGGGDNPHAFNLWKIAMVATGVLVGGVVIVAGVKKIFD